MCSLGVILTLKRISALSTEEDAWGSTASVASLAIETAVILISCRGTVQLRLHEWLVMWAGVLSTIPPGYINQPCSC